MALTARSLEFSEAAPTAMSRRPQRSVPVTPARESGIFHFIYLDQLSVIDGVCRNERIQQADDLVLGDEFSFPAVTQQARTEISLDRDAAHIRLLSDVEIGFAKIAAFRTHEITLMSDDGETLSGSVYTSCNGRVLISTFGSASPDKGYSLIALTGTAAI